MENTLTYQLEEYEGPLDLLLELIKKNKVDIHDIPIATICTQYMEYLEQAERMDMELGSEFIIMASELMRIKSAMLLPGALEKGDPREGLLNQLELYQATKQAAEQLRPLYSVYSGRMEKEMDEIPPEKGFPLGLDVSLMTAALTAMLARVNALQPEPTLLITPLIATPIVSVEEKIKQMVGMLQQKGIASLFTLLKDAPDKADLLARFMGVLELIKIGRVLICRDAATGELDRAPDEEELPTESPEDYNATAGLMIAFVLNPDYVPPSEEFVSEFEGDAPTETIPDGTPSDQSVQEGASSDEP